MGHDEKEVINVASETTRVRVYRHLVVKLRYFYLFDQRRTRIKFQVLFKLTDFPCGVYMVYPYQYGFFSGESRFLSQVKFINRVHEKL